MALSITMGQWESIDENECPLANKIKSKEHSEPSLESLFSID